MKKKVIIVGGFHEIIELCEELDFNIIGIFDNNLKDQFLGYKILGGDKEAETLLDSYKEIPLIITPDSPTVRSRLFQFYSKLGYSFETIISKNARISKSAKIGKGTIIQDGVNVSANTIIGKFVKLNTGCNVMHDCIINDFVTIAPNAVILGKISIGEGSYIGANSTILPNTKIGSSIIIGAGAVVTKDIIEANAKFAGIPARKL
jgi:sugar O-acyltransferase (sialic acid O-acetyltransferase NeuD family)